VALGLGVLCVISVVILRVGYGRRFIGGIPTIVFVWVCLIASGVFTSLARGARRQAWVATLLGLIVCIGFVLVERFIPD
jgi:hypothetical protein